MLERRCAPSSRSSRVEAGPQSWSRPWNQQSTPGRGPDRSAGTATHASRRPLPRELASRGNPVAPALPTGSTCGRARAFDQVEADWLRAVDVRSSPCTSTDQPPAREPARLNPPTLCFLTVPNSRARTPSPLQEPVRGRCPCALLPGSIVEERQHGENTPVVVGF